MKFAVSQGIFATILLVVVVGKASAFSPSGRVVVRTPLLVVPPKTVPTSFTESLPIPNGAHNRKHFWSHKTQRLRAETGISSGSSSETGSSGSSSGGAISDKPSSSTNNKLVQAFKSLDIPLLIYFGLWYVGNYLYKITNKRALAASGGTRLGFPMTISSLQLGIGALYAIFLWLAPDARKRPSVTRKDLLRMMPLAFCYAGAHSASVFSYGAGSLSFAEIVKAAEPAFAAVLSQFVYKRHVSKAKWWCLPIIIGGVILASANELNFAMLALVSACFANMFAAVRSNENKHFIESQEGFQDRVGCVGNQFALTVILGFLCTIPFEYVMEGHKWTEFVTVFQTNAIVKFNVIASALWFYGYNELSTMTLKKTGAVTQSVANTAKRILIIAGGALVFGETLPPLKILGCTIGIGGVFLYSVADQLFGETTSSTK